MISEYFAEKSKGKAVVDLRNNTPVIEYYDGNGQFFFEETYHEKSLAEVEQIAEDWAMGYHVLFE